MRMLDRSKFPPGSGGWKFYVPETNWSISPWISFAAAVDQIVNYRQANTYHTQRYGWSTDPQAVAAELDAYNARMCQQMGWLAAITAGDPENYTPPKSPTPAPSSFPPSGVSAAGKLSAGVQTIREWEIAGGNLIPQEESESRAKICSTCPQNQPGDLLSWFTEPAAALVKRQLEIRNDMKIHTSLDPVLNVCNACACPLRLKVHTPLDIIKAKMPEGIKAQLDPRCWILA